MESSRIQVLLIILGIWVCLCPSHVMSITKPNSGRGWRELVSSESGPPGVVWVVQVSDLHISAYYPERGKSLRKSLGHTLALIKPSLVLVTGDLTDAKNKEKTATRQDEAEWIEYRDTLQKVVDDSGIPLHAFFDMRGNHDKYGVPLISPLDYFSQYSISARLNRSSLVQSVTVLAHGGRKHLFVGVDDSMSVGLRGPSNLFGHPTDSSLLELDTELSQWDRGTSEPVTKIVFGHFPMSFTASTSTGKRPEEIFAKHEIAAYLCGHLHTKFGRHLYKHHKRASQDSKKMGEFWEWETGDWRVSRMMRVLAVDNGYTSFVDIELIHKDDNSEEFVMPTIILPTYPLDSLTMLRASSDVLAGESDVDSIRALVFAETPPISVMARIFDFTSRSLVLIDEIEMKLVKGGHRRVQGGAHYYNAPWESEKFVDDSATRYWLQIQVKNSTESVAESELRPFSVKGKLGAFRITWLGYLVMGFQWENFYPILLWGMLFFILALLVIPKIFHLYLERRGLYEEWVMSVFTPSSDSNIVKVVKVPFWAVLEGSRNTHLWVALVAYVTYLILFPWFSGRVLADDYPKGYMSLHGWTVRPSNTSTVHQQSGLGVPDIMGIVLPFVYAVLFPLVLMLSALSAERAACEFHVATVGKCGSQRKCKSIWKNPKKTAVQTEAGNGSGESSSDETNGEVPQPSPKEEAMAQPEGELETLLLAKEEDTDYCSLCNRLVRKALFVGCLSVAWIHWRLCSTLLGAYGSSALVASPAYAWAVPVLLVFSLIQTSAIRRKPAGHDS